MVAMLAEGVRPEGIVATTFTQKAAAELQERVRVKLIELGQTEAANQLGTALIGTVHSIGIKLLQRFAFDIGVSPLVEVIAEGDGQLLFNQSLAQVLTSERTERMQQLCDRLGFNKREETDWRRQIRELTDLARANNFGPDVMAISRQRSWAKLEALLPPVLDRSELTWQNQLVMHLEQTIEALNQHEADTTKVTRDAAIALQRILQDFKWRGELHWHEWIKITKTHPGAKSRDLVLDLHAFANTHDQHAQFRADLMGYIYLVFDIASDALREYESYKKKRGLIDYTDMETSVSRLLRIESVRATLAKEIDLLLVDEFQDTSPIQLDIFLQLSQLAKHSIWVGDPKQSIYGFRGAEPALMQAIIEATGGIRAENILGQSWRSRPDLVEASNAIFSRAFYTMPREQVVLTPARKDPAAESGAPDLALMHWHFLPEEDTRKPYGKPWMEQCVADQVRVLLERNTLIFNKKTQIWQPAKAGDVAILCRSNMACQEVALALQRAGLQASMSQAGLLETAEIKLVLSYMRLIINPNDRLSQSEILLLSGVHTLEELIQHPELIAVQVPRSATEGMSAAEVLQYLIATYDLRRLVVRLGNATQRLDNLECLRRYALEYESACDRIHSAATIGGFLMWLDRLAQLEQDMQGSGEGDDAVKVLTYHKSKGLEYPIVVMHGLESSLKEKIWGLSLVPENAPDLNDILGGRWIRLWIQPYADQIKNTPLEAAVQQTQAYQWARQQALEEEARLLYVGVTRARDYLIVPTTVRPTLWLNRVFNAGNEDTPTLDPDSDETPFYTPDGRVIRALTERIFRPRDAGEVLQQPQPFDFHAVAFGRAEHAMYRMDPQVPPPTGLVQPLKEPRAWGAWLEYECEYDANFGQAVQALLLFDGRGAAPMIRARVQELLRIHRVEEVFSIERVLLHLQNWWTWIETQFRPEYVEFRAPLRCEQAGQLLELEADLLLHLPNGGLAVIALVPNAEGMKKWKQNALALAGPLAWTRHLLRTEQPTRDVSLWVVFGVDGQSVEMG
jgi:ATP-dependent helicase/nuclease subunit A